MMGIFLGHHFFLTSFHFSNEFRMAGFYLSQQSFHHLF
jgi:hypothetical protein